jgi:hypothetical protein
MFLFSTRQTQHRFTGATQFFPYDDVFSSIHLSQVHPLSVCSQRDMNYNCVSPSVHPLAGEGCHLPETALGARHALARQPYGTRVLYVQRDLMYGDFRSKFLLVT